MNSDEFTALDPARVIEYECNLCGMSNSLRIRDAWREGSLCSNCKANARYRSIVHALSLGLFKRPLTLMEMPRRFDLRGVGLSDWETFAGYVRTRLNYINTYYHQDPKLDVVCSESTSQFRDLDFVISSEVFEHVPAPVHRAFVNAYGMLKPGGLFVFSVPYSDLSETLERFPNIHDYRIELREGEAVLINKTASGASEEFRNLIFHGGEGQTIEMRVFTESAIWRHLRSAGFSRIEVFDQPVLQNGIYWKGAFHDYVQSTLIGYIFSAVKKPVYNAKANLQTGIDQY